jgi:hypothetical protein
MVGQKRSPLENRISFWLAATRNFANGVVLLRYQTYQRKGETAVPPTTTCNRLTS